MALGEEATAGCHFAFQSDRTRKDGMAASSYDPSTFRRAEQAFAPPRDYGTAARLFKIVVDDSPNMNEKRRAAHNLGMIHQYGLGTPQNTVQAVHY